MQKKILSGNEAVARGAYEAGARVATAYPGTPSTEILECIARDYKEIDSSWAPNEKVAYEVGYGAAIAGARTLVAMKHVGVNVAADPLMTSVLTGITRGLVLISADDPGMHSSQNEQDNRNYSRFGKIPTLEPSDPEEARVFTKLAFDMSEKFDTPVIVRMSTRVCHTDGPVNIEEPQKARVSLDFGKDAPKYVMIPGYARGRHKKQHEKLPKYKEYSESFPYNKEIINSKTGIISSGVEFNYAYEAFPEYSFLKLSMIYPLPDKLIMNFASKMDKIYIVESLDPYIEDHVRGLGIKCEGKKYLPAYGELSTEIVRARLGVSNPPEPDTIPIKTPARPPMLCKGCPHGRVYEIIKDLGAFVTGDIGCYTLGTLKPYESLDTCLCMGASIGQASGFERVKKLAGSSKPVFAVIGDSTFVHSGITPLIEAVYNKAPIKLIILDNYTTAMTGHQPHPGTGYTLGMEKTTRLDYVKLAEAIGVKDIHKINISKKGNHRETFEKALKYPGVSVIIVSSPCTLSKMSTQIHKEDWGQESEG